MNIIISELELVDESECPVSNRPIPTRTLGVQRGKKMESLIDQLVNVFFLFSRLFPDTVFDNRMKAIRTFLSPENPRALWTPFPSHTSSKTVNFFQCKQNHRFVPTMSDSGAERWTNREVVCRRYRCNCLFICLFLYLSLFFSFPYLSVPVGKSRGERDAHTRDPNGKKEPNKKGKQRSRETTGIVSLWSHTRHEHVEPQLWPAAYTRYSTPHHGSANCRRMTAERTRVVIVRRLRALLSLSPRPRVPHHVHSLVFPRWPALFPVYPWYFLPGFSLINHGSPSSISIRGCTRRRSASTRQIRQTRASIELLVRSLLLSYLASPHLIKDTDGQTHARVSTCHQVATTDP